MSAFATTSGAPGSPAPARRRRVVINSKHATPELPVIEGAAANLLALDDLGLLPAAAIDCGGFNSAWSDGRTPTTAVPASREDQLSEDSEPEVDIAAATLGPETFADSGGARGGFHEMWCSMRVVNGCHIMISPVADGSSAIVPEQVVPSGGGLLKLWCTVQPLPQGESFVVPSPDYAGQGPLLLEATSNLLAMSGQDLSSTYWPTMTTAPTTLEVANLPDDLTQEDFLEILDREEASGLYDFVFLPSAPASALGRRVAILNCTSGEHAECLADKLASRTFWCAGGRQQCELDWFAVQGLGELVQFFSSSSKDQERPRLFAQGWPGEMPQPSFCAASAAAFYG